MKISVHEFVELFGYIKNHTKAIEPTANFPEGYFRTLTLRVRADVSDKLFEPIKIEGANSITIERLGVYKIGVLKIWVVKE